MRKLLIAPLCFLLNGCFVSQQPLITSQSADWPYSPGTHYTGDADVPMTLTIENGSYVSTSEGGAATRFLLKSISGGLYIAQVAPDPPSDKYQFGLLVVTPTSAKQYNFDTDCMTHKDSYFQAGLISSASSGNEISTGDCMVTSFVNLTTIFHSLYNAGDKPDDTLKLQK